MIKKTIVKIIKMDCLSEETLIRMKLEDILTIKQLEFDISKRLLTIFHEGDDTTIMHRLNSLNLGVKKIKTEKIKNFTAVKETSQKKTLITVLAINFAFFIIEISTGIIAKSMGLIADSLDMLADSLVYGISLFAVGGTLIRKKITAKFAGYFQIILACFGFLEVLRRFLNNEQLPNFITMIIISLFALIANSICLYLMQKSKNKEEVHMQASLIFTSNDIIINLGVIVAGILGFWLHSAKPDLLIGSIVFLLVIQGAVKILKLSK